MPRIRVRRSADKSAARRISPPRRIRVRRSADKSAAADKIMIKVRGGLLSAKGPPRVRSMADSWRTRGLLHWRTCPRRSASRTSPRVRRGPRRVRSESNGVRDFPADSWRTLSGLGGVRSGGLEGGVRSESNGVRSESARTKVRHGYCQVLTLGP